MNWRPRLLPLCLFFVSFAAFASGVLAQRSRQTEGLAAQTTIYRDNYGVPHVFCKEDPGCVFGFVYAQMEDSAWQVEDNYIRALGRAAEVYGEQELAADLLNRALEIRRLSISEYGNAPAEEKALYDAAAAGLNYFLTKNPGRTPRLIHNYEPWNVLALQRFLIHQLFIARRMGIRYQLGIDNKAAGYESGAGEKAESLGSNMWAVNGKKSVSGNAMLFINPHQPFFGPGQWYEGHVSSKSGWNFSGCAFFGVPFPITGFNDHLGWAHTVNSPDVGDLYVEKLTDANHYLYDDKIRNIQNWQEDVKVRVGSQTETRKVAFRKTRHGPLISGDDKQAISVRLARIEEGGLFSQWYAMSKANNIAQFKDALKRLAVPFLNVAYADDAGNILYVYNGAIPRRSAKFDWSKPVDGSTSETEWQGYHSLAELPQIENPRSGFVQNCNSSPFLTTDDMNPKRADFPAYMGGDPDTERARTSRKILSETSGFTFDAWTKAAFDTRVGAASAALPKLFAAFDQLTKTDERRAALISPVIAELKSWNQVSTTDSIPMTIFANWWPRTGGANLDTNQDGERLIKALEATVVELNKSWGTWRVRWGDINRLQRTGTSGAEPFSDDMPSLPVAGGPSETGMIFTFGTRGEQGQKRRYGTAGHSYVAAIEFTKHGAKARSLLTFGESSDTKSKHYFDQARLYSAGEFKLSPLKLTEITAHLESKYHPGERPVSK